MTFNTDFAQVEVDEQQVNLTRFNLFFPEKRGFFLESQGIFEFGNGGRGAGGGGRRPTRKWERKQLWPRARWTECKRSHVVL